MIFDVFSFVGFLIVAEKIFMATTSGYFKLLSKIFD